MNPDGPCLPIAWLQPELPLQLCRFYLFIISMLQIKPPTWAEVLLLAVEIPGFFFLPSYPGYKDLGETAPAWFIGECKNYFD